MHDYYYDKCVHQVDAWRGGEGHILALDQRGASLDPTYQGLFDLVIVLILWFGLLVLLTFFRNYLSASGYIWALHDPGNPLPMQSRILGCLWRRHTSGSLVQNLGVNYVRMTQVHKRLQDDLATLSSLVKGRGGDYDYLDPENIACSIDIWALQTQRKINEEK